MALPVTTITRLLVVLITIYATIASAACTANIYKFELDKYPNARCLDGSPGAIYIKKPEVASKKWMIAMEGGGECVTPSTCGSRAKTGLGSSVNYDKTMELWQLQGCDSTNKFKDWNQVWIKYCSGDLFMGMDTTFGTRIPNLQFSGCEITKATIDYLFDNHHMYQADDIILSGYSAGGLGAVGIGDTIFDWLYLRIAHASTPTQTTIRVIDGKQYRGPKVAIVPIAGYHFETDPVYVQQSQTDPKPVSFIPWKFEPDWRNYERFWNATGSLSQRCLSQGKWKSSECMIAQGNYETSVTPWFVIQSTVDSVVLPLHGGCPTVWDADSQGNRLCNTDDAPCPAGVKNYMQIWHGNITDHLRPVENKHFMSTFFKYPSLYPTEQIISQGTGELEFGWNKGVVMDGAFGAACLLHTEFALTSPIIDDVNYRTALWNWYNDEKIYSLSDTNPHYHVDQCPPGKVLCGKCKKW